MVPCPSPWSISHSAVQVKEFASSQAFKDYYNDHHGALWGGMCLRGFNKCALRTIRLRYSTRTERSARLICALRGVIVRGLHVFVLFPKIEFCRFSC